MSNTPQNMGNGKSMPVGNVPPEVLAYMENASKMQQIISHMKEIPVLQSEMPTDNNPLTKVEFPEKGGILTFMQNHPYPYKGFPYFEYVDKIDTIKKISRGVLSGFYHSVKGKNPLRLLLFIPLLFVARDLIATGIRTFYRLIERFRIKSHLYSDAVRAVYRAFDTPRVNESLEILELRLMLKDIVCTVLEFDNAYRYRFQDVIVEFNKDNDPIKELLRLLDIMSSRENTQEVRDTWKLLKLGVRYYLRFDRKMSRMIGDILSQVDLEQVKLSEEDKHFSGLRKDYNFAFKNVSN